MERRELGPTGAKVSVLGQGTWKLEGDNPEAAVAALRTGVEEGMTHIDTAEMYGAGKVEELVARALQGIKRDAVFLTSKVLPSNASYEGTIKACERSLQRLKTDFLNLYLLHWPGSHPLEDTFKAFEKLRRDGKIRAYGVSNFDVENLNEALKIAGEGKIACNQVLYHLRVRHMEVAVQPWCEKHEVAIMAYSPLGSGDFPSASTVGGKLLAEIGKAHNATPRQVALAFLIRHPHVVAIPKAATVEHVRANASAANLKLSAEDIARIDKAFPRPSRVRELPTL